ncbi:MAG TPA: hypothetical protein VJ914_28200 [Pseudonocardiaceae bacterium]|nr:hypothetical protein [Pseudonocardiaceae bacterium]
MTAVALSNSTVRSARGPGTTGLIRLTLRQHRVLILGTLAACVALALYLSVWRLWLGGQPTVFSLFSTSTAVRDGIIGYTLVVAMFWGAPLLSREYEQRTHLLVWSQDVSPARWLLIKVALLGAIAVAFAIGIELVGQAVLNQMNLVASQGPFVDDFSPGFESSILLQIGYTLAAFLIGLAIGGLVRLPVVATACALGVFGGIRWLLATFARENYLPPVHLTGPVSQDFGYSEPGFLVGQGDLDAAGHEIPSPNQCMMNTPTSEQFLACAHRNGFTGSYVIYQPLSRTPIFQLIEFGIFIVIALLCLAIAWFGVRRRQRI